MTKFKIIDIIPLIRLPFQALDTFLYFSDIKIREGSIVLIEFRKRKIYGYVLKINPLEKKRAFLKKEKLNLKPVLKIINQKPLLLPYQISLTYWLKNYANLSLGTSLLNFFPYKKLISQKLNLKEKNKKETDFILKYKPLLDKTDFLNKKTLIIVPRDDYLRFLAKKFEIQNIISAKISEKKFLPLIEKIIDKNKEVFLATKNGIFLPWQFLDQIIIYEEGSIFYKEFFKEPYFDYRKIFLKFAEIKKIEYLAIDSFPSFSLIKTLKLRPEIKINFQRINFFEFEERIKEFKKTIIFVPQKSFSQKIICENCHFSLTCPKCEQNLLLTENELLCHFCFKKYPLPKICPNCQKETNFVLAQKGAEAIYNYLKKIGEPVIFLKKESQKLIKLFQKSEKAHLVGSLYLLTPELTAQALFFFNFSQFYFSADPFLKEKFLRILEFFSKRVEKIFLISEIINPEIERKIKEGKIVQDLLKERKINSLPPYKRLIILKEGSTELKKLQEKMMKIKNFLKIKYPVLEIIGPIFSRPFKIKKRFFLELIIKVEENLNLNLKKILEDVEIEEIEIDAYSL